ncbi:putative disease resistance protein RGA4 [Cannabis sativa]|uniref:putative disease resistance protein RGA4 n=1 Tax=Cannabis sativa TaxID=3483 RepID=UPI0029C9BC21|nr:putative disease resistance protein RGA4 [Cannabis sativa]
MAERNWVGAVDRILRVLGCSHFKDATIFKYNHKLSAMENEFQMIRASFDDAELMKTIPPSFYDDDGGAELLDNALYDVDDLLREMLAVCLRRRHMSSTKNILFTTLNSSSSISNLLSKIDKIMSMKIVKLDRQSSLSLHELATRDVEDVVPRPREAHSSSFSSGFDGEGVVGRKKEQEEVKELLLQKDLEENVLVIPIYGRGGVGKTTLAKSVYNDEMVANHFHLRIWVYDGGDAFNQISVMKKIVGSITANNDDDRDLYVFNELKTLIVKEIRHRRFLLVLDDVKEVDEERWKVVLEILLKGGNGSRVIVTTRHIRVAQITGSNMKKQEYELDVLNRKDSLKLLLHLANNSEFDEIGEKIVEKCGGIPSVIRAVGGILSSKHTRIEWEEFDRELSRNVLNSSLELENRSESEVVVVLSLSYDHLPSVLKDCFAFCAIFPKDYEIDVDTLVSMWMSLGFIQSDEDVEELGYGYLRDLIRRSLLQETKKDEYGKIKKCKVPNSMHEVVRKVTQKTYATLSLKEDQCGRRHVSFDFHLDSSWHVSIPSSELGKIRSLILPRQYVRAIEGRSSQSICDVIRKLKWIRMLDLHNSGIKKLTSSIGELKLLSYLDLSHNVNIKKLPNSICGLYFLETLKLNRCSNLRKLPKGIIVLLNLRHLENKSCYRLTQMPRGLSELSNLRTLSEFGLSKEPTDFPSKPKGKLDELSSLNYLKGELKIKNLTNPKDDKTAAANLEEKKDLLSLILIWDIDACANEADYEDALEDLKPHPSLKELCISTYGGSKFSSWLPLLKNLVKLSLSRCNRCHCLPRLDKLINLQVLVVDELIELEYIVEKASKNRWRTWFSSLKELRLSNLPKLKGWWKDASKNATFSCVSKLVVEDCPFLTSMPLFPWLEELLVLKNTSWEPFKRTMALPATPTQEASSSSSSSSSSSPLSKLRELHIMDMSNCDPNMWQSLHSLRSVTLDHVADINVQLQKLQELTTLQGLHIRGCDSLMEIPRWISNSDSLRTVSIKLCPNLTIPRERLSLISTSKKVEIEDCPRVSHIETMLKDPLYTQ